MTDYYAVLGVPRDAGEDAIRQRFRQLARERHPDRHQGADKQRAETEFQVLTEAFNVLTDAERRHRHDVDLEGARTGRAAPATAAGGGHDPREVARAWLTRGVKAYKEKRWAEAAELFERATLAAPADAQGWYYLALAASHEERWLDRARRAIETACRLEPMNVVHLRAAGRILARSGDAEAAERYYREALRWSADDPAIRRELEELTARSRRGPFGLFGRS
jgi:curved DNA-binding protein CbpA